jgi:hypothetical protein
LTPVNGRGGGLNALMPQYFYRFVGWMMKKLVFAGALLALAGCVQVDNYATLLKRQRRPGWKDTGNRKARRVK